ncbi:unnamed protein product, partial [Brachionus calyciflorus]
MFVESGGLIGEGQQEDYSEIDPAELHNPLDDLEPEQNSDLIEEVLTEEGTHGANSTSPHNSPRPITPPLIPVLPPQITTDHSPETPVTDSGIGDFSPQRGLRVSPAEDVVIENYYKPATNIRDFNEEFPVPKNLFNKWKDGVRIWPKKQCVRTAHALENKDKRDLNRDKVVKALLDAEIIQETVCNKPPRYCASLFLVLKANKKARPIVDYSALTEYLKAPKFKLKSLFQVVNKKWPPKLFYSKIDFSQAFFNINLHPNSKHVTTFVYNGKYYVFNRMPFGLSIAPYVQQQLLNCIIKFIKKFTPYTYGHLDDIIIGHSNPKILRKILKKLLVKLNKVGWQVNYKKSVLYPSKSLEFLGAKWTDTGVERTIEASKSIASLIKE